MKKEDVEAYGKDADKVKTVRNTLWLILSIFVIEKYALGQELFTTNIRDLLATTIFIGNGFLIYGIIRLFVKHGMKN